MIDRRMPPSTRRPSGAITSLVLLLAAGCESTPTPPATRDPLVDASPDAASTDAASPDAASDLGLDAAADATSPTDATSPADAGVCPQTPTTPDSMGRPRDAAGYIRYCWPGESRCFCDGDNDCYAMDDYVPCVFATRPDAGSTDLGSLPEGGVCPAGTQLCPTTPFTNEPRSSFRCRAPIGGACPGPDLVVGRDWLVDPGRNGRLYLTTETFAPGAAEIDEGCVTAPGTRRLLRFNFAAFNVGNENLNVGRPDERDTVHWEFFSAHGHWHVKGWGDLQLRRLDGVVLGRGRKLSFCLEDNIRINDAAGPRQFPPPLCEDFDPRTSYAERPDFGLSVSWGDIYPHDVRCQFIDIGAPTPGAAGYLADGFYNLILSINLGDRTPMPLYRELDYTNNSVSYRLEIRGGEATVCNDLAGEACPTGTRRCDGSCGP